MDKKTWQDTPMPNNDIYSETSMRAWALGYNAAVDEANRIIDELRSQINGLHSELDDIYGNPYGTP